MSSIWQSVSCILVHSELCQCREQTAFSYLLLHLELQHNVLSASHAPVCIYTGERAKITITNSYYETALKPCEELDASFGTYITSNFSGSFGCLDWDCICSQIVTHLQLIPSFFIQFLKRQQNVTHMPNTLAFAIKETHSLLPFVS